MKKDSDVSITVIRRLPKYYRYLGDLLKNDINRISSQELSNMTGFTASQIRQDLNNFGGFGQQGYGYNVEALHTELGRILGLDKGHNVVVTGAGNLGHAVALYGGFRDAGFNILGMFDENPDNPRIKDKGTEVHHIDELEHFIKENNIDIGIITCSKEIAQDVADIYVRSGVKGIWNFATIDLVVPDHVSLESVRLSESLFTLSYFVKQQDE